MKLVILGHQDWLVLKEQNKVIPALDPGKCALALHMYPETKHWRYALVFFTALEAIGIVAGIVLLFIKWWIGLGLLLFSLGPLRKSISKSVNEEVLRVAETNSSFFSYVISTGGLRFWVKEEDLKNIDYLGVTKKHS